MSQHHIFSVNCQWPEFGSTKAEVAAGRALSWRQRLPRLVQAIKNSNASIVLAQELGRDEARDLFGRLPGWTYDRAQGSTSGEGLNCVGRHPAWEQTGKLIDLNLSSWGQMQRTLIGVPLQKGDDWVLACSTHLATKANDLSAAGALRARSAQMREVIAAIRAYGAQAAILGMDANSRGRLPTDPQPRLVRAGWRVVKPSNPREDRKRGIDVTASYGLATIAQVRVVPLGRATDHDGRAVIWRTVDPA